MRFPSRFLGNNFPFIHVAESKIVVTDVEDTEVVCGCHRQTLGRANGGAQSTEAALTHVDVESRSIDPLWRTIGGLAKLLCRANGLDRDAIHGTYLRALIANDTVVDLIVKLVSAGVGYWQGLMRELDGCYSLLALEVVGLAYVSLLLALSRLQEMSARQLKPFSEGLDGHCNVSPI